MEEEINEGGECITVSKDEGNTKVDLINRIKKLKNLFEGIEKNKMLKEIENKNRKKKYGKI